MAQPPHNNQPYDEGYNGHQQQQPYAGQQDGYYDEYHDGQNYPQGTAGHYGNEHYDQQHHQQQQGEGYYDDGYAHRSHLPKT